MERDPVCGIQVKLETSPAESEYNGQTYYFCSDSCKGRFDANPELYVSQIPS
jgi:YHS domain-containing protein